MDEVTPQGMKVVIPHVCLQSQSGLLLGWKTRTNAETCYAITAVAKNRFSPTLVANDLQISQSEDGLQVLGVLVSEHDNFQYDSNLLTTLSMSLRSDWILIEKIDSKEPKVTLMRCDTAEPLSCDDMIIVVYDGSEVLSSVYLMNDTSSSANRHGANEKTNIYIIAESLSKYRQLKRPLTEYHSSKLQYLNDCIEIELKPLNWMFELTERILLVVLHGFISALTVCSKGISFSWLYRILNTPAVCSQLKGRFDQIKTAVNLQRASPLEKHRSRNLLCLHVFDVFLGILLMTWILSEERTEKMSALIMDWAENVAAYLQSLLLWMMGSPAGLKLNRQLSQLLGKFFTYHIYLWTGYLGVLRPVQVGILQGIATSGMLGLSVQLSLLRDLVSMMTLHIYCFYVYAARLYCLQMYALSSLWRLFRGKKWNVLRQRVDSASFDIDQLFIGTLFFTILLFLLPTTALYYVVFTALRLIVLSIQGGLYKIISLLNVLPVASLAARVFYPGTVSDRVKFTLIPKLAGRPLYLAMETQPASLTTILTSLSRYDTTGTSESWGSFTKKLFLGELIYPWIEPTKEKSE